MSGRRATAMLGMAAIVALCLLGAVDGLRRTAALLSDNAAFDRRNVEQAAAVIGVKPRTAEYAQVEKLVMASSLKLSDMTGIALMHVVPGTLLLPLGLVQFSRRIRSRHPAWHRWNGRMLLILGGLFAIAALALGVVRPTGGAYEASATVVFGGWFIACGIRGYACIRRRDTLLHREWMLRMFGLALAASVIRVLAGAGILLLGTLAFTPRSFGLTFWVGFLVSALGTELWILRTRRRRPLESAALPQPL